mgnify:CR=1 FL=1
MTSINGLFLGASSFNQDIGEWSLRNIHVWESTEPWIFENAISFNQDISKWNTPWPMLLDKYKNTKKKCNIM